MNGHHFFTVEQVAEGIWAAIAVPGSGAQGNAAIVDLGDITVVVDTFLLPQAGKGLRETAERLTSNEVKYVVNTHFHGDHHYGNQEFIGSTLISTQTTREILLGYEPPSVEVWQSMLRKQITDLADAKARQTDNRVRTALTYEILEKEQLFTAVPAIQKKVASFTFDDRLMIHGTARTTEVITFGGGHTKSDAFVYIPQEKVLIAGDLVLGKSHPAMLHGDSNAWLNILERMKHELDVHRVIPGHGKVTGIESLSDMTAYIHDIEIYAKQAAESDQSVDYWLEQGVPRPYDSWELSHVFEWNLRWLFNKYKTESYT